LSEAISEDDTAGMDLTSPSINIALSITTLFVQEQPARLIFWFPNTKWLENVDPFFSLFFFV
jgi:hypothetical protein